MINDDLTYEQKELKIKEDYSKFMNEYYRQFKNKMDEEILKNNLKKLNREYKYCLRNHDYYFQQHVIVMEKRFGAVGMFYLHVRGYDVATFEEKNNDLRELKTSKNKLDTANINFEKQAAILRKELNEKNEKNKKDKYKNLKKLKYTMNRMA